MTETKQKNTTPEPTKAPELVVAKSSVALQRLIEEVRNDGGEMNLTSYNRTYHRHNR